MNPLQFTNLKAQWISYQPVQMSYTELTSPKFTYDNLPAGATPFPSTAVPVLKPCTRHVRVRWEKGFEATSGPFSSAEGAERFMAAVIGRGGVTTCTVIWKDVDGNLVAEGE